MKKLLIPICFAGFLITGCASQLYGSLPLYMKGRNLPATEVQKFPHCQNYGCRAIKNVVLSKQDWKIIEKSFGAKAKSAAQEREKIAKTIGTFEQVVGPITKTQDDKRGTFIETGDGQLDCVDESTNTTVYMLLLEQKGLIAFHTIEEPQVRYPVLSGRGWMHQTAVLTEKNTGEQYAIDSWFDDNGAPARVAPLMAWRNGWRPAP